MDYVFNGFLSHHVPKHLGRRNTGGNEHRVSQEHKTNSSFINFTCPLRFPRKNILKLTCYHQLNGMVNASYNKHTKEGQVCLCILFSKANF